MIHLYSILDSTIHKILTTNPTTHSPTLFHTTNSNTTTHPTTAKRNTVTVTLIIPYDLQRILRQCFTTISYNEFQHHYSSYNRQNEYSDSHSIQLTTNLTTLFHQQSNTVSYNKFQHHYSSYKEYSNSDTNHHSIQLTKKSD